MKRRVNLTQWRSNGYGPSFPNSYFSYVWKVRNDVRKLTLICIEKNALKTHSFIYLSFCFHFIRRKTLYQQFTFMNNVHGRYFDLFYDLKQKAKKRDQHKGKGRSRMNPFLIYKDIHLLLFPIALIFRIKMKKKICKRVVFWCIILNKKWNTLAVRSGDALRWFSTIIMWRFVKASSTPEQCQSTEKRAMNQEKLKRAHSMSSSIWIERSDATVARPAIN